MFVETRQPSRRLRHPEDAYVAFADAIHEKAILPSGSHVRGALKKAAEVMVARKGERAIRMNELLGYLLDQFPGTPAPEDAEIIGYRPIVPDQIEEDVLPLLVMSELLCGQGLWLDMSRCSNWPPFVKRYGEAVFA